MWVLLAVALAIVITAAFVDDITFAGHTFKKAPIADLFVDKSVGKADTIAVDSVPVNMKEEVTTDSLPQSLLIFGDSMTYNLALRLAQYAKQNGHIIHAINWDSSNTKIWAEHDTLQYYIRQFRPTQIFISLGSNELYFKNPESRTPYVKKIIEVIDTVPFVWIGPLTGRRTAASTICLRAFADPEDSFVRQVWNSSGKRIIYTLHDRVPLSGSTAS